MDKIGYPTSHVHKNQDPLFNTLNLETIYFHDILEFILDSEQDIPIKLDSL